jgi:hypothetical protein
LLRGVVALRSAAELVGQLGGRGCGVFFGHVRAKLRHFKIETELVEDGFGVKDALDYLVGEKLPMFAGAARYDAAFAHELPRFLAAVWRVFNEYELAGYVAMQKRTVRRQLRALLYFS